MLEKVALSNDKQSTPASILQDEKNAENKQAPEQPPEKKALSG